MYGDMFKFKIGNGLYLSGTQTYSTTEYLDLYNDVKLVSAANPPFYGIPVTNFKVINNNEISFYLPEYLKVGNYDVIYCNPAGYFKMSDKLKNIPLIVYDI